MNKLNFNTFDLNLVRVFLALWELRSVTGAAESLNLTQPAVSHALNRLRAQFDDPLFSRIGKTMEPTTVARALHPPFRQSLEILRESTSKFDRFDPEKSVRVFHIAMSDISEAYFLPELSAHVLTHAPNVQLRSVQLSAREIEAQLRSGQVDIALGFLPVTLGSDFKRTPLFQDRFQCILSDKNPFKKSKMSLDELQRLNFVEVANNATGYQKIKSIFDEPAFNYDVRVKIEHFNVVPEIVKRTRLAAIFPASIAKKFQNQGGLRCVDLPPIFPTIDISIHEHSRVQNDLGLAWLISVVRELFSDSSN